jgi:hypothetical protein
VETPDTRVEPAFQGSPLPSPGQDENPESEFAENDGIDCNIRLMCAKPRYDTRVGRRLRRLAQNRLSRHPHMGSNPEALFRMSDERMESINQSLAG